MTSSWMLDEFDRHAQRLDRVSGAVGDANKAATATQGDNAAAYGILFGGVVSSILDGVCGDFGELTTSASEAVQTSADNIRTAKKSYEATEDVNQENAKIVSADVAAAPAVN